MCAMTHAMTSVEACCVKMILKASEFLKKSGRGRQDKRHSDWLASTSILCRIGCLSHRKQWPIRRLLSLVWCAFKTLVTTLTLTSFCRFLSIRFAIPSFFFLSKTIDCRAECFFFPVPAKRIAPSRASKPGDKCMRARETKQGSKNQKKRVLTAAVRT